MPKQKRFNRDGECYARRRGRARSGKPLKNLVKVVHRLLNDGFTWYLFEEKEKEDKEFINRICSKLKISPDPKSQEKKKTDIRLFVVNECQLLILARKRARTRCEENPLKKKLTHIKDTPLQLEGNEFFMNNNGVVLSE
jgi:hypothetical protein